MKIRRFIRDKSITCLLLLALSLSFFITFIGADIILQMKDEADIRSTEHYEYGYVWNYSPEGPSEIDLDETAAPIPKLEVKHGNLILSGAYVSVANSLNTVPLKLVISQKEAMKQYFLWGELSEQKNTVVIYEGLCNYTYEKDHNVYIVIEKEEYKVTGVVKETTDYNYGCLMYYDSASKNLKEYANAYYSRTDNSNTVELLSDTTITDKQLQPITDWCKIWCGKKEVSFEPVIYPEEDLNDDAKDMMSLYFSVVLLAFSMINSIVIGNTWIERRKKEFIIRKTYGESVGQIFIHLFIELSQHAAICGIFVLFFKTLYQIITKDFYPAEFFLDFIVLLSAIVIFSLFIVLVIIVKIAKIKPGRALKDY